MATIPITIFLVQQQLKTTTEATPNTTLAFIPDNATASVGEAIDFDIRMSPGSNLVSFVKIVIKFDPTKISADETSFIVNPASG